MEGGSKLSTDETENGDSQQTHRPQQNQRRETRDHSTSDEQQANAPPIYQSSGSDTSPSRNFQARAQVERPEVGSTTSTDTRTLGSADSASADQGTSLFGKTADEEGESEHQLEGSISRGRHELRISPVTSDPDVTGMHDNVFQYNDNGSSESPDKRPPPPPPPTPADVTSPSKEKSAPKLPSFSSLAASVRYQTLREADDVNDQRSGFTADESENEQRGKRNGHSLEQSGGCSDGERRNASQNARDVMEASQGSDVMVGNLNRSSSQSKFCGACPERAQSDDVHERGCWCTCVPVRFIVVMLVFLGMTIINAMRTNVGVMVLTVLDKQSHRFHNSTGDLRKIPSVDWDSMMIGFLHSVFYIGYMFTNIPGAYLTTRLPSHTLFGACILVSCLLNLTLPVAIEMAGYQVTIAIRFVQGLSEGLLYPACYGILRHWSTPPERGRLGSLVFTGAYIGPVVGFPLAGIVTDFLGWQYSYYINGGLGVLYVFVWAWLSEEKPSHHKLMSADELSFIEEMQGSERIDYEGVRIPWGSILTSPPVAALCLCHFARNWVFIMMLTNEPFFLNTFHFTIAQNGVYSALPHMVKVSASFISGYIADFLLTRKLLSTTKTRKLLTSGFGMQALCFVLLAQTTDGAVAVTFLTVALGFGGLVVSGWQLNHYDLSARHASVLVGVTSCLGNFASIAAPLVAGTLTQDTTNLSWNQLWYITAGVAGLACLAFLVFGSGERQSWSLPADGTHLVVKEDTRRRRRPTSSARPNSVSPAFSYSKLPEGSERGHMKTSRVPDYGSQRTTPRDKLSPTDDVTSAQNSDVP